MLRVQDLSTRSRPLSAGESQAVRTKSDELLPRKKWSDSWNQEAAAGADRGRLEAIALASLAADFGPLRGHARAAPEEVRRLSDAGKAKVHSIADSAEGRASGSAPPTS